MNKHDVIEFFDRLAPEWDADMVRDESIIKTILDNVGIAAGVTVLDVAYGTGFLFPDYLKRNVVRVAGIDISEKMIEIAKEKLCDPRVTLICADAETTQFESQFDCCVVYNAFPHFPNPYSLIRSLAANIKVGGKLTIAHGSSREHINHHHMELASMVSVGLMSDDELVALLSPNALGICGNTPIRLLKRIRQKLKFKQIDLIQRDFLCPISLVQFCFPMTEQTAFLQ